MVLLTPGPCQTSDTVRAMAAMPDLNHREEAFLEIYSDTRKRLLNIYPGTKGWQSYVLGGGGSAAMEAMATSCVSSGPVLVLENGYYSARMAEIFRVHAIPYERMSFGWLDPISLVQLADRLSKRYYEAILLAHHETTTGRLNALEGIGKLARERGIRLLVDAMSSFGADPISFEHVDALCASSNKCLHGIPGVSFVLASPEVAALIPTVKPRTYYLDLAHYAGDEIRSTPPVPALAALRQALIEMGPGGAAARHSVYAKRAEKIRKALRERDLVFVVEPSKGSCSLTVSEIPPKFSAEEWFAANRAAGYELYGCKGDLKDRYFQIANMGELTDAQIDGWLQVFKALT